ncbi:MAG: hypothetical protein R3D29_03295 [Nitratireductor sp.]
MPNLSKELRSYAQMEHISGADFEAMKLLSGELLSHAEQIAKERNVTAIDKMVETGPVAGPSLQLPLAKANMIVIGSRGLGNIEATLQAVFRTVSNCSQNAGAHSQVGC